MIVEWFLSFVALVLGWFADLFGAWEIPAELADASAGINSLVGQASSVGVWVNWPILNACIGIQLSVWATVLGIKLARAIGAHLPWFGGSGD